MHGKVSRNAPCPCGSGKKHKLCCLPERERAPVTFSAEVRERAFDAFYEFAKRDEFVLQRDALLQLYLGPLFDELPAEQQGEVLQNEDVSSNFLYWFLLEGSLEGQQATLVNRFLSRRADRLPLPDRRYLEAMRDSHLRLYEVEAVRVDEGLQLRDCWDGTRYDVRERLATHQLAAHSVVALRLRLDPDGAMVIDGPGFAGLTHADKEAILTRLRSEHEAVLETDGDADGRFGFYHGAAIAQHVVYQMLLRPPPRLITTSGEPVLFCRVIFNVKDVEAVRAALERTKELSSDNEDSYVWVRGKGRIIHASISLKGGILVAETHSAKRATAVRKLLERQLGGAVRYDRTDEQDLQSALEEHRSRRPGQGEPEEPLIPKEIEERLLAEYEERHYRSWIDTPLPALANKTPRQAAQRHASRAVLVGLLKDFIASSELERRAGRHAYDFSWMWAELGIDPKDPTKMRRPRALAKRAGKSGVVYRLKVTLTGAKPPIWRRVLVSGDEPLDRVHMILNCAMGWTDTHLHSFEIQGKHYSVPVPGGLNGDEDERQVRLAELPLTAGSSFRYSYDFGNGWKHRVVLEAIEPAGSVGVYPICEAGRRACPPEDVGGIYGYGPDGFDPDAFDVNDINAALRNLPKKWQPIW
jgi:hypothetical protein